MQLYELLQDRGTVNALKLLYDSEAQKHYALRMADLQQQLPNMHIPAAAQKLITAGLASADAVGGDAVLTITDRGKQFIKVFDQLIAVSNGRAMQKSNGIGLEYGLAPIEQELLRHAHRILENTDKQRVSLSAVAKQAYPNDARRKLPTLERHAEQLCKLGLLHHERIGKHRLIAITEQGKKVIEKQLTSPL